MKATISYYVAISLLNELNKYSFITGKLGFAISRTKNVLRNEVQIFNEERNKLLQKYGKLDENGNYFVDEKDENFAAFNDEIIPLVETKFEMNIYQVTQEEFDKADIYNESLSVEDYDKLQALFIERVVKQEETV